MRARTLVLALIVSTIGLTACGAPPQSTGQVAPDGAPATVAITLAPGKEVVGITQVFERIPGNVTTAKAHYANQADYATDDGRATTRTVVDIVFQDRPRAVSARSRITTPDGEVIKQHLVQMEDRLYLVRADGTCVTATGSTLHALPVPQEEWPLVPSDIAMDTLTATPVEDDVTVNGIRCRHYTVDAEDTGRTVVGPEGSAEGELWIATEGEYVVRYTMHATDERADDMGTLRSGVLDVDYEVYDVDQPVSITPPAACQATATATPTLHATATATATEPPPTPTPRGSSPVTSSRSIADAPVLDGAERIAAGGLVLTYDVSGTLTTTHEALQERLTGDGWEDTVDARAADAWAQEYERGDRRLLLWLRPTGQGQVRVRVMVIDAGL
jgi:hypothetical protein